MSRIAEAAFGDVPLGSYPETPGYKTGGTSRDAARAVSSTTPLLREQVFNAIRSAGDRGLTPDEAAAEIGATVLAVRPRFTELAKAPARIVETGERRRNESGLKAKAWRAR